MTSQWVWLLSLLPVIGCAQQVRIGVDQTRSTIPQILEDQALNNAAQAYFHPLAIPAQIKLISSATSSTNGVNSGVAPNIALRAIAITGISLTTTNSLSQNWASNPVSGYLDLKLLQMFYGYATDTRHAQSFDDFEQNLDKVVAYKPPPAAADTPADAGKAKKKPTPISPPPRLSEQIGALPKQSGFITVNDPNHCSGGVERIVYYTSPGDRVCVMSGQEICDKDGCHPIDADALLSLFVLWSVAIPDLSSPNDKPQRGSSPKGSNFIFSVPSAQ